MIERILIWIVFAVVMMIPAGKILSRVGLPPVLAILAAIPLLNIIFFYIVAFARWPAMDVTSDA